MTTTTTALRKAMGRSLIGVGALAAAVLVAGCSGNDQAPASSAAHAAATASAAPQAHAVAKKAPAPAPRAVAPAPRPVAAASIQPVAAPAPAPPVPAAPAPVAPPAPVATPAPAASPDVTGDWVGPFPGDTGACGSAYSEWLLNGDGSLSATYSTTDCGTFTVGGSYTLNGTTIHLVGQSFDFTASVASVDAARLVLSNGVSTFSYTRR